MVELKYCRTCGEKGLRFPAIGCKFCGAFELSYCRSCGKKGMRFGSDECKYCGSIGLTTAKFAKQIRADKRRGIKKKKYGINPNFFYDLADIIYYVSLISFILIVWVLLTINPLVAITFFTIISVLILFFYFDRKDD